MKSLIGVRKCPFSLPPPPPLLSKIESIFTSLHLLRTSVSITGRLQAVALFRSRYLPCFLKEVTDLVFIMSAVRLIPTRLTFWRRKSCGHGDTETETLTAGLGAPGQGLISELTSCRRSNKSTFMQIDLVLTRLMALWNMCTK